MADLGSKAVQDPYASVRIDVDIARHRLPPDLLISGLVYDVDTGLIEVVVPAAVRDHDITARASALAQRPAGHDHAQR